MIRPQKEQKILIGNGDGTSLELSRDMVITFAEGLNGAPGPEGYCILASKRFSPFLVLVLDTEPHTAYPITVPGSIVP